MTGEQPTPQLDAIKFLKAKDGKINITDEATRALNGLTVQMAELQALVEDLNEPLSDHTDRSDRRSKYSYLPFVPVTDRDLTPDAQKIADEVNKQLQQAIGEALNKIPEGTENDYKAASLSALSTWADLDLVGVISKMREMAPQKLDEEILAAMEDDTGEIETPPATEDSTSTPRDTAETAGDVAGRIRTSGANHQFGMDQPQYEENQ